MRVLANDGISTSAIDKMEAAGIEFFNQKIAPEQLSKFINEHQIDVLLVRSATQVPKELMDACPSLKIIGRGGIGLDNIDVSHAKQLDIKVINTPTASSKSVAELVFGHFISMARFLHESNRLMPLEGDTRFKDLKKDFKNAIELSGKTLGVIGFGSIGKEVIKIGIGLGMKIKVLTRHAKTETVQLDFFDGQSVNFEISTETDKAEFLKNCDFISINTPKTSEYILSTKEFEEMKNGVYIVNTSRGGVLDEVEMLKFIENKKIAGVALDVFESEPTPELTLLMNPALSLSPHVGGNTIDAQNNIGLELADQLIHLNKDFF